MEARRPDRSGTSRRSFVSLLLVSSLFSTVEDRQPDGRLLRISPGDAMPPAGRNIAGVARFQLAVGRFVFKPEPGRAGDEHHELRLGLIVPEARRGCLAAG